MTTFDCQLLVEQYSEWIREGLNVEEKNGSCVITSPFLDRHHDYLQIYVQQSETGYSLSDDGYTLRDLKISGLEINTERRTEALHNAIRPFGIQLSGDELQIAADTISDFPQKKHDLIQAMLAVGDLIHLAQATVTIVFKEDVGRYLRAQGVQLVPDVRLTGTSGFHHPFDFVVGQTPNNPERYVRAINTPTR